MIIKIMLVRRFAISLMALTATAAACVWVASGGPAQGRGDTAMRDAETKGTVVTQNEAGPLFAALRRPAAASDLGFAESDPETQRLIAEDALEVASARRVLNLPGGGSAWLIPSKTSGLCFIVIEASGAIVHGCLPEEWAAAHGGFGVVSGGEDSSGTSIEATMIIGVLPDGSHALAVTTRGGRTVNVPLNGDNAYSAELSEAPTRLEYADASGVVQQRPLPSGRSGG